MTSEQIAGLKEHLREWKALCFDWAKEDEKALKQITEILEAYKPEQKEVGIAIKALEKHQRSLIAHYSEFEQNLPQYQGIYKILEDAKKALEQQKPQQMDDDPCPNCGGYLRFQKPGGMGEKSYFECEKCSEVFEPDKPAEQPEITEKQLAKYCKANFLTIITNLAYEALMKGQFDKTKVSREKIMEICKDLFSESVYPLEPGESSTTKMAEKLEERLKELGIKVKK